MKCPRCGQENPAQAKFCLECASPLTLTCGRCGTLLLASAKFCPECAHPVGAQPATQPRFASPETYTPKHLAEKILTSRGALEGERKQVTVLFTDIVNSTGLAERLGAESMHALINWFFELALTEVHRYEGVVNQFHGDGFMALFGAPLAYEDHARRAILAALRIQHTLRERRGALGPPHSEELAVRIGLNTGPVVVGKIGDNLQMDYTAVGDTTNLAARLQQMAEPDTILLSEATSRLVRGYVHLTPGQSVSVKGKAESVMVYKVLGIGQQRSPLVGLGERSLSRFVGRERELRAMHDLLARVEEGQGQVIGIVGEAGIGKSRLLYEFRLGLTGRPVTYVEGRCLSYGSAIPYHPLMDIIRHNCGITDADPPTVIGQKVRFALHEVGMDPEGGAPYLLHLLGVQEGTGQLATLTPEIVQARTVETIREMSLKGSRRRPLIFAVEDLHWTDKTSEDCLASLFETLVDAPILFLSTYRAGYRPPWIEKSYATQIALRPLLPQDSLTVVHSAVQTQVPGPLAQAILEKAEGNPFFLEELTRAVVERGDSRPAIEIPDTVQGVLMARIDRLHEDTKRVLQTASVLGRRIPTRLLEAVWDGPGLVDPHLRELKRLEFLYELGGTEEPTYLFKHALTQEVAYESLLIPHRHALHAAAGRALEALYADRLEQVYDRLAYHYSKSMHAVNAVEYLSRFARGAARAYAHAEAVIALQEALVHAERLPTEERDVRLNIVPRLARSLSRLGRFQEALDLLLHHQERVEQLKDDLMAGRYHLLLAHMYAILGDRDRTAQSAHRTLEEAARCGDDATMGKAHYVLALEGFYSGQFHDGIGHGREAITLLERTHEPSWLGQAYWAVAVNQVLAGDFERALEALARAHAIGEAIKDPRVQSPAVWTGLIYALRGEWEAGIEACRRGLEISSHPYNDALAMAYLGYAYLLKGDLAQAIPLLEQAVQQFSQFQVRQEAGLLTAFLAEAYLLSGDSEKAQTLAVHALELTRNTKFRYGVGVAQRILGRTAQARGTLLEAAARLKDALETFSSIQARFEIGRTRLDLAALAHAQGDQEAVTTDLNEAHALFRTLRVPNSVARTEQLARAFGVPLLDEAAR